MEKVLFTTEGKHLYKANLHSHSTISDGHLTPSEMKEVYKKKGYSAVAFTDHEIYLQHNDLSDDSFIALNATEYSVMPYPDHYPGYRLKYPVCHMCLIAKKPDIEYAPVLNDARFIWGNAKDHVSETKFREAETPYLPVYTGTGVSDLMHRASEEGFFVTYNHPDWSGEGYAIYSQYEGMNAMEIINGSCLKSGFTGNAEAFVEMIRLGRKIYCIAADDNHNKVPVGHVRSDSCLGYVQILAESLSYENLTDALFKGKFFSGTGDENHVSPDILRISYNPDESTVSVQTTPTRDIYLRCLDIPRGCQSVKAGLDETITEGSFKIPPESRIFQIVLKDWTGYQTYSNPYFLDDIK